MFEEDKGFWAAIQTFISTTKRPIILTTCDASVTDIAERRYELITLKRPTPVRTDGLFPWWTAKQECIPVGCVPTAD